MPSWFMSRLGVTIGCSALAALCATGANAQQPDSAAWLADLTQLRAEMSSHYANLQWSVDARGLDLPALTARTERQLAGARTVPEARAAIDAFLRAFGDGHLSVSWPSAANGSAAAGEAALCSRLGFREAGGPGGLPFHRASRFTRIQSPDSAFFPAGVVETPSGRRVGVLRIGLFSEYAFPQLCDEAARELGLTASSPCDEACEDRMGAAAGNLLTAALVRQLELLGRERTELLLVDITGNGGGTNWVQPAARTLTAVCLQSPAQGFVRHPHWAAQFARRVEVLQRERRRPPALRARIDAAIVAFRRAGEEAGRRCDLAPLWEGRSVGCSQTARPGVFASGALAYAAPGELGPSSPAHRYLFSPSLYSYREGVYSGPLAILVDRGTASSAEYFTAMLADNGAATVVGHPTDGSGCGYTNGGIRTVLPRSGAVVRMPDCVRYRADGSNEVEGVTPHVLVPWHAVDNPYQRAKRVVAVLDTLRIPAAR